MSAGPEALLRQAQQLEAQGSLSEAIAAYRRLLDGWPDLPNCWFNLAVLLRRTREFAAALDCYQQALDRGVPQPEEVHLNRSVIYTDYLHQHEEAERELTAALALNPRYVPALLNLANLHEDLGRRSEALGTYERILALEPNCLPALARYANLRTFSSLEDPLIWRLQRAIMDPGIHPADRAALGFALGRALDACGVYPAAFEAYSAANRDSRASAGSGGARYDREAQERLVEQLLAAFPAAGPVDTASAAAQMDEARGVAENVAPAVRGGLRSRPRPIFVCGMFRSGSTLIEQVLAGHPRITAGGELDLLPQLVREVLAPFPGSMASVQPHTLQSLANEYLDSLARLFPGADYVTDKRPDNFLSLGLIKRLFPDARIIHTTRDPLDNCLSIFFLHLDHSMSYALELMDIGHHYRQYRRLMAHWKALYAADILDLHYDTFVREPNKVLQPLLNFLGLEWDDRCLAFSTGPAGKRAVKTASVWQVREGIYQTSSGRARHYAQQLAPLRDYLGGDL